MEGAKTDTQVSACKPFPPKMVKQPTQPSRQTSKWTRTTDWRLKNYNVSSPGEKSEARRNQCLGREKVPAVKLKKEPRDQTQYVVECFKSVLNGRCVWQHQSAVLHPLGMTCDSRPHWVIVLHKFDLLAISSSSQVCAEFQEMFSVLGLFW